LLKNCEYIIGNSSAGIREASFYSVPSIDIGTRQAGRYDEKYNGIIHAKENKDDILDAIKKAKDLHDISPLDFGKGDSCKQFMSILKDKQIWECDIQKNFVDIVSI